MAMTADSNGENGIDSSKQAHQIGFFFIRLQQAIRQTGQRINQAYKTAGKASTPGSRQADSG
jgi:hypothetical protein